MKTQKALINFSRSKDHDLAHEEACQLIASKGLEKEWKSQFEELTKATKDTGYGFGDSLSDMFHETF